MEGNETNPVDILFVVPDTKCDTWHRAVKHTLWAIESDKTFKVISADVFVRIYGDMSDEEMYAALKKRCIAITNSRDISKREWKRFKPLLDRYLAYMKAKKETPTDEGTDTE